MTDESPYNISEEEEEKLVNLESWMKEEVNRLLDDFREMIETNGYSVSVCLNASIGICAMYMNQFEPIELAVQKFQEIFNKIALARDETHQIKINVFKEIEPGGTCVRAFSNEKEINDT